MTAEELDIAVDEATGMTLTQWRECVWWPALGTQTRVHAGVAGHDREIMVFIDGYEYSGSSSEYIPTEICDILKLLLPGWFIENRGTRLELHPSGSFAGDYKPEDVDTTVQALKTMGFGIENVIS